MRWPMRSGYQTSVEETLREYGYKGKVEVVNNGSDLTLDASSALLRIETRHGWVFVKENRCFYLLGSTFGRKYRVHSRLFGLDS